MGKVKQCFYEIDGSGYGQTIKTETADHKFYCDYCNNELSDNPNFEDQYKFIYLDGDEFLRICKDCEEEGKEEKGNFKVLNVRNS